MTTTREKLNKKPIDYANNAINFLTGLKNQNKNLENLALQRERKRKTWEAKSQGWEAKCQEIQNKNDKLINQVTGKLQVHGEKNIIWDAIIEEARKFRPYLDYVLDK